ncbi:hypothetical protein [Haliangium sp.]|uniref:hypothetical protein n=1 Tax=Haliangium sp. TaxID=2663208 RepID=UPI003D0E3D13
MSIQAGDPFRAFSEEYVRLVRTDVTLKLLSAIDERSVGALMEWVTAIEPEDYQRAGFDEADAAQVRAARPLNDLLAVVTALGDDVGKLGDLVYAAAAVEAASPQRVLVEEVYELSALGEVAFSSELAVPIPVPTAMTRLQAVSAYLSAEGKPQTVEHRPILRQRKLEDTWAEIELGRRSRLWYLAALENLATRAELAGQLVLFPRLGSEFLDTPVLTIAADADRVDVAPVSTKGTHHVFYAFPEISGELFMLRLGVPPKEGADEGEDELLWPDDYRFRVETGDILLFGPSYPSDIELRIGGGEIAWRRGGELLAADRSRDVAEALQSALGALAEAPVEVVDGAEVRRLRVAATSRTPGTIYLGLEAEIDALVDRFASGRKEHEVAFTRDLHEGEVALALPGVGTPAEAVVTLEGTLSNCVIMQHIGATDAPTGDDKIGVRVPTGITYSQTFEVEVGFELSAVDLRVAEVSADTRVVIELRAGDAVATSAMIFERAVDRHPVWQSLRLDLALPLEPETTYELQVWVSRGQAVWLCGAGDSLRYLRRHQGNAPPARVEDVADESPLLGELRLRSDVPVEAPALSLSLLPGPQSLAMRDVEVFDDGSFRAVVDLVDALGVIEGSSARLRLAAPSEGAITVKSPLLRYRLRVEAGS